MNLTRGIYLCGAKLCALLGVFVIAGSAAAQPTLLGQVSLTYKAMSSDDGTFEWTDKLADGSLIDVYTYCFSVNNYFDPNKNPQVFNVWSVPDLTTTTMLNDGDGNLDGSAMLGNNSMANLTAQRFLYAMAQAETFGPAMVDGSGSQDDNHMSDNNADIHDTESGTDHGPYTNTSSPKNTFLYLQQADPKAYTYGGQPQGIVNPPGGGPHLNITPEPVTVALSIAGLALAVRRRIANR